MIAKNPQTQGGDVKLRVQSFQRLAQQYLLDRSLISMRNEVVGQCTHDTTGPFVRRWTLGDMEASGNVALSEVAACEAYAQQQDYSRLAQKTAAQTSAGKISKAFC